MKKVIPTTTQVTCDSCNRILFKEVQAKMRGEVRVTHDIPYAPGDPCVSSNKAYDFCDPCFVLFQNALDSLLNHVKK